MIFRHLLVPPTELPQALPSHVTAGRLHLHPSASSPPPGPDCPSGDAGPPAPPGLLQWSVMALLDAIFCCLLSIWHSQPGLGLPLAPASGQRPAPAVGESSVTLSLPGAARERRGGSARSKSEKVPAAAQRPGRDSSELGPRGTGRQQLRLLAAGRARATETPQRKSSRGAVGASLGLGPAPVGALPADEAAVVRSRAVVYTHSVSGWFTPGARKKKLRASRKKEAEC